MYKEYVYTPFILSHQEFPNISTPSQLGMMF